MSKEKLIWLTREVYRLTLLFPKKEPLRYKMRELADDILAECLKSEFKQEKLSPEDIPLAKLSEGVPLLGLADLEVLDGFFEVAKDQNWVKPEELLAIQREYANLWGDEVENIDDSQQQVLQPFHQPVARPVAKNGLNQRQEMILEFLRDQGRAQVWQIKKIMPDISKRTLRRDFERMLEQGAIERIGEKNETFYQIKTIEL